MQDCSSTLFNLLAQKLTQCTNLDTSTAMRNLAAGGLCNQCR